MQGYGSQCKLYRIRDDNAEGQLLAVDHRDTEGWRENRGRGSVIREKKSEMVGIEPGLSRLKSRLARSVLEKFPELSPIS